MVPELAPLGCHQATPQGCGQPHPCVGQSWQHHDPECGGLWRVPPLGTLKQLHLPFHRTSTRRLTARPCTSGEHSPGNTGSTWGGMSRAFPAGWGWQSGLRGRVMALCAQTVLTVVPHTWLCHSQVPVQAEGLAHQLRELHGGSLHAAAARPAAHGGHGGLGGGCEGWAALWAWGDRSLLPCAVVRGVECSPCARPTQPPAAHSAPAERGSVQPDH